MDTLTLDDSKQRRTKAVIGVILFHALMVLLFWFNGLSYPVPLPEAESAMIELGWSDTGSGITDSPVVSEEQTPEVQPQQNADPVPTPVEEVAEDVATQEDSPVSVPKAEESAPTPPKETTPEPVPDPEPTASDELKNAMDNVFNTPSGGGGDGEDDEAGNVGRPTGSKAGKGVMGGSGNGWELSGRGYVGGVSVGEKPREEGTVVLNIWVGRDGKVKRTSPNLGRSTTTSQHLFNLAKKAAMNGSFSADASASVEQKGTLTFYFVLE